MKVSKLTLMALTVSLAMILSFVETQIPPLMAIPGMKVGLANIAVVFALYRFGWKEAIGISLIRVFLTGLLFGTFASIAYSLAGAILSFAGMVVLKRIKVFSCIAVSVMGGVLHNVGQIAMASILMGTELIRYYLPFLLLSGTVAGVAIGVVAGILIKRIGLKETK